MAATVTVMPRFARSYPRYIIGEPSDRAWPVPLGAALEKVFEFDAHFVAYASPIPRRLGHEAIDAGLVIELTCIPFDVDYPGDESVPDEWRANLRSCVDALAAVYPDPFFYESRGGGRVIYELPKPFAIASRDDAQRWRRTYATCLAHLERRFGIVADPACADWQRLYRLPYVVRDGVRENRLTSGDPHKIGALSIDATDDDVDRARRILPRAFFTPRSIDMTPSGKPGLFFYLLDARGWILREHHEPGVFVIRCPNDDEHSPGKGSPGNTSTLLYPPTMGKTLGAIYCKHAHCEPVMTAVRWLSFFSQDEQRAAQDKIGSDQ